MRKAVPLVFERSPEHEQVTFCHDRATGLRAIIAIHSTALGPALGGTRFYPYPSEEAALTDVLHLSQGMTYKNALAGLGLGGGKAVIIGDPNRDKTDPLLHAYGRFVSSLGGRYITACDVGTVVSDMDVVSTETPWVTGRSTGQGGAGDSSVLTSFGVFQGMRAVAEHLWGKPRLAGKKIGVSGVGKVGSKLADLLLEDGAEIVVTDISESAIQALQTRHPGVTVVEDNKTLLASGIDIFAPCALGGALNDEAVASLNHNEVAAVCGGANNQLDHPGIDKDLDAAGILYAPDYVVNSGGVIQVADELNGFNFERARNKVQEIFETTRDIFALAENDGVPPAIAADRIAERRIADARPM